MNQENNTILIVDDNATNLGVLFEYLRDTDFKVLVAEDGEGALQRARFARPDIILLDVMMPGIDGFETCRRLKQDDEIKDIPIIFMTALSETVDKLKGFEVGAVDYVTKPVEVVEVLARIRTHLALRQLQKQLQIANGQLSEKVRELDRANADLYTRNIELQEALDTIKTLSGVVPICAWCHKNIQDDYGDWVRLESYIEDHSDATFTHGICPTCLQSSKDEVASIRRSP
jgi:DNA-binding response OmpR family regulator